MNASIPIILFQKIMGMKVHFSARIKKKILRPIKSDIKIMYNRQIRKERPYFWLIEKLYTVTMAITQKLIVEKTYKTDRELYNCCPYWNWQKSEWE